MSTKTPEQVAEELAKQKYPDPPNTMLSSWENVRRKREAWASCYREHVLSAGAVTSQELIEAGNSLRDYADGGPPIPTEAIAAKIERWDLALRSTKARPDPAAIARKAWEDGFALCRSYTDNHAHFSGEQKERQWLKEKEALGLAAKVEPRDQPQEGEGPWIPVGEELPGIADEVLWKFGGGSVRVGYAQMGDIVVLCGIGDYPLVSFTHWMPLPTPPPTPS